MDLAQFLKVVLCKRGERVHLTAAACTPTTDANHRSSVESELTRDAAL
jgi:hypothetical protein